MLARTRGVTGIPAQIDRWLVGIQPSARWLVIGFLVALNGVLFSWLHWQF